MTRLAFVHDNCPPTPARTSRTGACRRVPGHSEGDLIIGARGKTAAATLVERITRYTVILPLPESKDSAGLADVLIDSENELPAMMRKTLTWDQGSEMARHGAFTLATAMPVFFAHPHSPWERGTNENTNSLIRDQRPPALPDRDRRRARANDPPRASDSSHPAKPSNDS